MLRLFGIRVILAISGLQFVFCLMYKYGVDISYNYTYIPCEEYPDNTLENYTDTSSLVISFNDENSYTVVGELILIHNFQQPKYETFIEIYKRGRVVWQNTLYSIRRPDFCQALFNPLELWSRYAANVPVEQRRCPLKKGMVFSLNFTVDGDVELPDRKMDGDYKLQIEIGNAAMEAEFMCTTVFISLYRK